MILAFLLAFIHPIHIAVMEVNYSEKDQSFQIVGRLFIDDLEAEIRRERKDPELDLLLPKQGTTKEIIRSYLTQKVHFKINGKPAAFQFIGCEKEDVSMVYYLEIPRVKKVKSLEASCQFLIALYDDQSNLVHVKYNSPVKSARLMRSHPSEVFNF